MKNSERLIAIILLVAALAFVAIFVIIATKRTLTSLESVSLQLLIFIFGLSGSFILGRQSAHNNAQEIIKPHARSAFRRVLALYKSLSRLAYAIDKAQSSNTLSLQEKTTLEKFEAIVTEQIATANDALEDWKDIVPDDVKELSKSLLSKENGEEKR
jgi:hypothetical protein